jgi:N-acetylmuramoyl-L-alanine amidase
VAFVKAGRCIFRNLEVHFSMFSFQPDSSLVAQVRESPNQGERAGGCEPDMILLHYTGMPDAQEAVDRLCSADSQVSAHYVVFEDGHIVQCVPEARRAWHAGISSWAGATDINSASIGIEIANPGHDHGYPAFPTRQIAAVTALCRGIIARRTIPPARVLAHSDVAPARKQDPGEQFPWRTLHRSGVGHWVASSRIRGDGVPLIAPDEDSNAVREIQSALAEYGYGLELTGRCDEATRQVVTAFQRHFRPEKVDGLVDRSTAQTLERLLESRPS